MNTYIYSISDEFNNIRYIGKANNLRKRLYNHINVKSNPHKYNWLHSIIKRNQRPKIEIIDEVPIIEWEFWEQYWISQFKTWGFELINISEGGIGGDNYKHTDEAKERMRNAKLGKPLSKEHCDKLSLITEIYHKNNPNFNKVLDRKITLDKDELYDLYIIQNLSMPKISKLLNVSEKVVFTNLNDYNIKKDKSIWKKQCSNGSEKKVLQYDMEGNFIKEWNSVVSINKELGYNNGNLAACCRGVVKSCMGYIWKYKDNI